MTKQYLDYNGLKTYDEKIKAYMDTIAANVSAQIVPYDDTEVRTLVNSVKQLVGEDSVESQINAAIAALINNAPDNLDTLKEIAEWINTHGEAASALVESVASLGSKIDNVEAKVDAITAISTVAVEALFYEPIVLQKNQTVQEAIDTLEPEQKLVLSSDVDENLIINKDAVIEAEGVVFSGTITVNKDVNATIIGATFSGEVVLQ